MKRHASLLAVALILGATTLGILPSAQAQTPDVSFTISASSQGPGTAVPTLSWSSTPAASSCTASGDWSGTKTASGTAVLAAVNANKAYRIVCNFLADSGAVVSWTPPTTNSDGTPYTDLAGYKVYWNTGGPEFVTAPTAKVRTITSGSAVNTTISGLTAGTWYFAVASVNSAGVESPISNVASKTIGASTSVTKNAALVFPGTSVVTVK